MENFILVLEYPDPPVIDHASIGTQLERYVYGTLIDYTCHEGYFIYENGINNNTVVASCGPSLKWDLVIANSNQDVPKECACKY